MGRAAWAFAGAVWAGAFLTFWVEPLIGKWLLPRYGGAPAVWMTCLVFFQAALLAGYGYAHLLARALPVRGQVAVHLGVLAAVAVLLPPRPADSGGVPDADAPILALLGELAAAVGGPFLALSATAPLFQQWFPTAARDTKADPYPLYAASNAGSLGAVAGFPLVIEPGFDLDAQAAGWAAGYGAFVGLAAVCGGLAWRGARAAGPAAAGQPADAPVTWRDRALWVALSAVPSSLLLGCTYRITVDVAPIPLLWMAPLGVYLLTFVVAFSGWGRRAARPVRWVAPVALAAQAAAYQTVVGGNVWVEIAVAVGALAAVGLACHGRLAASRPPAARLTEFYLLMSAGGVVGAAFNTFLAPVLFVPPAEYPLALAAAGFLLPTGHRVGWGWRQAAVAGAALAALVGVAGWAAAPADRPAVFLGALLVACLTGWAAPVPVGPAVAVALAFGWYGQWTQPGVLHRERTFFGVVAVKGAIKGRNSKQWTHRLVHGNTSHGHQLLGEPASVRRVPRAYFHPAGPAGQVFDAVRRKGAAAAGAVGGGPAADIGREAVAPPVGIVGLGTGALAAYGRPGQEFTFYELDPAVERVATNPTFFTYLRDSPADCGVVVGDARLRLRGAPAGHYGLLVMDAFSSDAVPTHLVTAEAVDLYLAKLRPDGLLAFHITNRYLDLEPVLGNLAAARPDPLTCVVQRDLVSQDEADKTHRLSSAWVVMARTRAALGAVGENTAWKPARTDPRVGVWTDRYSNVLRVLGPGGPPAGSHLTGLPGR